MKRPDRERLHHMLEAAEKAAAYADHHTLEQMIEDDFDSWAIVKLIEIIGEAANHVSQDTRDQIPDIPWSRIVAMRNRLVHVYFDVNPVIVWQTLQTDIPTLIDALKRFLDATNQANPSEHDG